MKVRQAALAVLALVVALTSVAAAQPDLVRQRVVLSAKGSLSQGALYPSGYGRFKLTPLEAGVLERGSGTVTSVWRRIVVREDQKLERYDAVTTWTGVRGCIVVRERVAWTAAGDGSHTGSGSWEVVHGTGPYAGISGEGRSSSVWLERGPWASRYSGTLSLP